MGWDKVGYQTGLAISTDLINWEKEGLILPRGQKGSITEYNAALTALFGNQIYSTKLEKVYKKQKGICPYCHQLVTDISEVDTHHMLPVRHGGTERLNNLWLLHQDCHKSLHSEYSLEQMRDAVRSGKSYLQPAAEGESCMR